MQIDDRLDRLQRDGSIESLDLVALAAGATSSNFSPPVSPAQTVWVYSVSMQRLLELALR